MTPKQVVLYSEGSTVPFHRNLLLSRRHPVDNQLEAMEIAVHQAAIGREVFERHAARRETMLEVIADFLSRQARKPVESSNRAFVILDDKARQALIDDFPNRTAIECDDRCSAGHRLYHDEAERLRPVDRIEQRDGSA